MKKLFCFLLIASFLFSCSVKKRSYRNGYYVDWAFNHKKTTSQKQPRPIENVAIKSGSVTKVVVINSLEEIKAEIPAVNESKSIIPETKKQNHLFSKDDGCGDVISFLNGKTVKAKVIEVNETSVKYKRCDNLNGPDFVTSKSELASIKYSTGALETFGKTENGSGSSRNSGRYGSPQKHPDIEIALICLVGTVLISGFGPILAFIFARRAEREILANPNKYYGLQAARTIKIISGILIAIMILAAILTIGYLVLLALAI